MRVGGLGGCECVGGGGGWVDVCVCVCVCSGGVGDACGGVGWM